MEDPVIEAASQYLFFKLNDCDIATKADNIKEIVKSIQITKVPSANKAVRGVTNIRGELIPVVDLNVRFDHEETRMKENTTLVILTLFNEAKQRPMDISMLVDVADELEDITEDDILPPPSLGLGIPMTFVENMVRVKDEFVPALNIDAVFDLGDLSATEELVP